MVAVFFTFALSGPLPPKEMGVILGIAVLLDAFLVRLLLVPVLLRLAGRAAWYLPSWLGRVLPDVRFGHGERDARAKVQPGPDCKRDRSCFRRRGESLRGATAPSRAALTKLSVPDKLVARHAYWILGRSRALWCRFPGEERDFTGCDQDGRRHHGQMARIRAGSRRPGAGWRARRSVPGQMSKSYPGPLLPATGRTRESVVIKLAATDQNSRDVGVNLGVYLREVTFLPRFP